MPGSNKQLQLQVAGCCNARYGSGHHPPVDKIALCGSSYTASQVLLDATLTGWKQQPTTLVAMAASPARGLPLNARALNASATTVQT